MSLHPTGSPAWFVPVRNGRRCELRPKARAGWLITLFYALAMTGMSLLLLARGEPRTVEWIIWGLLAAAMTAAFLIIAWRTSETVTPAGSGEVTDRSVARSLIVAILGAGLIIGAALFGLDP